MKKHTKQFLFATAGLLSLLGCDPGGVHKPGTTSTDGGMGDPSDGMGESQCEIDESTLEGPSLLDAGRCVVDGLILAECRSSTATFRNCDSGFLQWCDGLGGDVHDCAFDVFSEAPLQCGVNSLSYPACDAEFAAACDRDGNTFLCDGPACNSGRCAVEEYKACCDFCSTVNCSGCTDVDSFDECSGSPKAFKANCRTIEDKVSCKIAPEMNP